MEWKDIASVVARNAPMLGGILGGPPGAAIGAVGSMIASALGVGGTPDEVSQALLTNPDVAVKLKEIESTRQVQLATLVMQAAANQVAAETAEINAVNKTMQGESASEHWPSYSWRPAIGFSVALAVVLSVLTVFGAYAAAIVWGHAEGLSALPGVLAAVAGIIAVVSPILGIASYFRGKAQADPAVPTVNRG